ncbi:EAL domain-containing protein [Thalassotalea sp. PLHSN55]|uniref:bifunctional diguanylate cyclase/phosphodiesterase n=1 Tax=Thalassotalea sp. PLHSN55 TaxID=3435888 RepID=UPI003F826123
MEPRTLDDTVAIKQIPKLKSLLKRYRQVKTMQTGLLNLSELASTVTQMAEFYSALEAVISSQLVTDNFHVILLNNDGHLASAYCHNPKEKRIFDFFDKNHWQQSLTEMVFTQGEVLHCNAQQRLAYIKSGEILPYDTPCQDWLGVPLVRARQVIGVIAVQSYDDKMQFDDKDSQLLQFMATHLVTAIDRIRSRELLEQNILQRTQKLTETNQKLQSEIAERQKAEKLHTTLLSIAQITASEQSLSNLFVALHQELQKNLQADNFYICLLNSENGQLEFPYYVDNKSPKARPRSVGNGLTEMVIKKAKPVLISQGTMHSVEHNRTVTEKLGKYDLHGTMPKAWLAAPLLEQGSVFGVLVIQDYQDPDAYASVDLQLIQFVSQNIAIAINRVRAQEKIQQSNEQLEILVNERTQALQTTNMKLRMQIEERRKAEEQLYFEAHHDALTQLPNRAMFSDRLSYALRHLKRHPKHKYAVLFIDLDRFKMINDTLGHHAGDLFLIEIAKRLRKCVRDNDILARLGGDEFVILLDSVQCHDDVEEVASRIIESVAQPFDLEGHTLYSNASIGIALCSQQYSDANELLRDADAAMYQAKSLGRGRYVFFDESMRDQLIASMTLEQELRVAIKERQFELHYQKISDLEHTTTIGFEGLLRWNHPSRGILTPSEFLFMAEETGMILEIENWVVESVAKQLVYWRTVPEYKNAFIGINLSGRHLTQSNQLTKLISLFKHHKIEPQRLILEFNESAFTQHGELALKGLRKLKEFGVKLALDDYGAGISSFNFLHNYPFEFIKLDRSFIKSLATDSKNITLVKVLNELGAKFGYRLVAEGIETEETLAQLKGVGCEFGQGYYISRPCKILCEQKPKPRLITAIG